MAIKTNIQETIPELDVEYLQFSQMNMSISKKFPYKIALSAKIHPYGKDSEGTHVYTEKEYDISISDMNAFIFSLPPEERTVAVQAMVKIQEALGYLAEKKLGVEFLGYE